LIPTAIFRSEQGSQLEALGMHLTADEGLGAVERVDGEEDVAIRADGSGALAATTGMSGKHSLSDLT
jgi:hypothetical protein